MYLNPLLHNRAAHITSATAPAIKKATETDLVRTTADLEQAIDRAREGLLVLTFCQVFGPSVGVLRFLRSLTASTPNLHLAHVDVCQTEGSALASAHRVENCPTTKLMLNGVVKETLVTTNQELLRTFIIKYSAKAASMAAQQS